VSSIKYRPDIDGLRSIAVLAVIFFHLNFLWIPGGYVGVDIFFVISGYLITSIILKEIDRGAFTLVNFYERRIRRIIPAAFATVVVSSLFAYALLLPRDLDEYAYSVVATVFYVSNLFFWTKNGYFQPTAEEKPLLHTWSLSVEEQFYIFFPLFVLISLRFVNKKTLFIILVLLSVVSLGIAQKLLSSFSGTNTAFYFLPTRAWELAIGGLLAFNVFPPLKSQFSKSLISFTGAALIFYAVFFFNKNTPFPGLYALFPCLGTACIIFAGLGTPNYSVFARFLGTSPAVFIGKISYSLYLIHWPVIAFWQYRYGATLSVLEQLGILGLTFVMAVLSWKYIENPFRNSDFLKTKTVFLTTFAIMFLLSVVSYFTVSAHIGEKRMSPQALSILEAVENHNPLRDKCNYNKDPVDPTELISLCTIGDASAGPVSAIVWGDSHADAVVPAVDEVLKQKGKAGLQYTKSSCMPVPELYLTSGRSAENCLDYNSRVKNYILENDALKYVFMAARWTRYQHGVSDTSDVPVAQENSVSALAEKLQEVVAQLNNAGKTVIIFGPVPELDYKAPDCLAKQVLYEDSKRFSCAGLDYAEFEEQQNHILSILKPLPNLGAHVIYPSERFCEAGQCYVHDNRKSFYYDDNHLSQFGASRLVWDIEESIN
tara:strand:+ start:256213 stop:258180 length:1968 start_codon:yes stop_codon:yes gene_type:complete